MRVIRKSIALGLYRMEVVKLIDDTYWSLSDDTIIMPSSDKKEMVSIKRKSTNYSTRKAFLEKAVVKLVYKFDETSHHECLKSESIAKVRFKKIFWSIIWTPTPITLPCSCCVCGVKMLSYLVLCRSSQNL